MNILFLCTANVNRSKTAEVHFSAKDPARIYRSAGLSEKECHRNQTTLCTEAMLLWADVIFVMEDSHIRRIEQYTEQRFLRKIINLDIPDIYKFMDPALIEQLEASYYKKLPAV
ncbi:hypothetical protein [uncultured Rheinheimera sp.]|uniref:hypothetical protein n=1 Tax=uncultured Rheinheimera sp. TaxID=400532 RepID=UPI00259A6B94|nr:hypothetical protein [uncultured Rheinheimera sp.]